jgi:hypothetical protein
VAGLVSGGTGPVARLVPHTAVASALGMAALAVRPALDRAGPVARLVSDIAGLAVRLALGKAALAGRLVSGMAGPVVRLAPGMAVASARSALGMAALTAWPVSAVPASQASGMAAAAPLPARAAADDQAESAGLAAGCGWLSPPAQRRRRTGASSPTMLGMRLDAGLYRPRALDAARQYFAIHPDADKDWLKLPWLD